ncbi:MAG: sigma-70 family RNA polymerase sigma factor [Oscillospiraceae bacterium]|nr:sigma-70 family RNA polymerase sigma factor [Oscillospiraceae bacterium]
MMDYTILSESELLSLLTSGDRKAEECLAERYMRLVRACARPLFLAGGDSEDLTQEGMFGLLNAIRQFDPSAGVSFHTFAEHCIRMRLLSAVRSASRLKHLPLNDGLSLEQLSEDPGAQLSAIPVIFRRSPEDLVLARESKEELYAELAQCLSKMEAQVLERYLEGLSYREIAQELKRDEKSVDNAVQRIRRKLARNPNLSDISNR